MKNILILCDDYYPSSRATIAIVQRFAEGLVDDGLNVVALTIREKIDKKPDYPTEHNGVRIIDYGDLENLLDKSVISKLDGMDKKNSKVLRFIQREKKLMLKNSNNLFASKWNGLINKVRRTHRKNIYDKSVYKRYVFHRTSVIEAFLEKEKFDTVVSIALPFSIHHIASNIKSCRDIKWVPISFDPYAYDEVIDKAERIKRENEETKVYKNADKIMFLSQFEQDYCRSDLIDRIIYFELPNIRPLQTTRDSIIRFDKTKVNCVFLGNLFWKQRNPEYLFHLVDKMSENAMIYIVGGLIDISRDYMNEYVKKSCGKLVYLGRVSQESARSILVEADVLINLGNLTTNQCPSKLIDYIATGKPILNIAKIDKCTSKICLTNYPNKFLLDEKEELSQDKINALNEFLQKAKNSKNIPYEEIEKIYSEYTIESMIRGFLH